MTPLTVTLRGDSPGTARTLTAFRYAGAGSGPKVYLQAGLHADEMPGVLVLQCLLPHLDRVEGDGKLRGEVLVVPLANPIGLAQWQYGKPLGRREADSGENFNRLYPELDRLIGDALENRLTGSEDENRATIRAAFRAALAAQTAASDLAEQRLTLLGWSCDADYVLDLHCDHEAVMHLYASPARPEDAALLCRCVGAELALIQERSGGNAFDEAHTVPWVRLRQRYGDRFPIPAGCFSATLEYRGQFDVSDEVAAADARNLMTFLAAIGAVDGWPDAPAFPDAVHLPLGGAAEVFAPAGGVIGWSARPGARVGAGDVLAHVTDPATRVRHPVVAPVAGMMFRHELWRSCLRGQSLAHVAGQTIVREGYLLSD
jgi:hypothetical protein